MAWALAEGQEVAGSNPVIPTNKFRAQSTLSVGPFAFQRALAADPVGDLLRGDAGQERGGLGGRHAVRAILAVRSSHRAVDRLHDA